MVINYLDLTQQSIDNYDIFPQVRDEVFRQF
jgi:hypothetical protein